MGIKLADFRTLWARSGNRCAFKNCKIELTPSGSLSTLGEVAHIVGKKEDGPRGNHPLEHDQRDNYDNLILLCPTHHTLIDSDPGSYPVEILRAMKNEHENWIVRKLDESSLLVRPIDISEFIDSRKVKWQELLKMNTWIIMSITPLELSDDLICPYEIRYKDTMNQLTLPGDISINTQVNLYHTRPNENGLVNDDFRKIHDGQGHRIEIFRNGHCEFLICLDQCVLKLNKNLKAISYDILSRSLRIQIDGLLSIWKCGLPFQNALFTIILTNTSNLHLDANVDRGGRKTISPYAVESDNIEYDTVIEMDIDKDNLHENGMGRLVNAFGWILKRSEKDGKLYLANL